MVFVGYGVTAPEYRLGRLRRHRHARQDRGDPHQRSGIRHQGRDAVSRPGNDLLRTLDLQVRGGRAARRHGRHHRPPDRTCCVWLGHGREQLVHAAARSRHCGWQCRVASPSKDGSPSRAAQQLFAANGTDAGGGGEARQHARISRRTAEEHGQRVGCATPIRRTSSHNLAALSAGNEAARRIPRLHGALGPPGAPARMFRRLHLQRRRGQRHRHLGSARHRQGFRRARARSPSARSCSSRSRSRSRGCWVRRTTSTIRCSRWRRPWRRSTWMRCYFGGPTRDVTVVNIGASRAREIISRKPRRRRAGCSRRSRRRRRATFFRSDHFNFAKRGVPALYIKSGIDDREHGIAWRQKYLADFTAQKYHKVGDEYSPDADLRAGVEDLALLYAVGAKLAGEKTFPNWKPDSEFRAARDRSTRGSSERTQRLPASRLSGDRAAFATLRARICRACVVGIAALRLRWSGNRKSPNKVTFMSWLFFRFPRRLELRFGVAARVPRPSRPRDSNRSSVSSSAASVAELRHNFGGLTRGWIGRYS